MEEDQFCIFLTSEKLFGLISNTLSYLDTRLVRHGERVAYLTYAIAQYGGLWDTMEPGKLYALSVLHDIGAFKTDEVDAMISFDSGNIFAHSVYGYLFLHNMTRLNDYADCILYHHSSYRQLMSSDCKHAEYAALIHLADRLDILFVNGVTNYTTALQAREGEFDPRLVALFEEVNREHGLMEHLADGSYEAISQGVIEHFPISAGDGMECLKMLVNCIDFRSEHTVTHTINTVAISSVMAKLAGASPAECEMIYFGATLHDIGKIATPTAILEKPGRLSESEMRIMQRHVVVTDQILTDVVPDEIREIASRHHEKLDGSGYPLGLSAEELTLPQRIVALADIISALGSSRSYKEPFPKERILSILTELRDNGKLDLGLCDLAIGHYDEIVAEAERSHGPVIRLYNDMHRQYEGILRRMQGENIGSLLPVEQ